MKRFLSATGAWLGVCALLVLFFVPATGPAMKRAPFATGSGHLDSGGAFRNFTFNARRMMDGTVKGRYQLHNRAQEVIQRGVVDCLRIEGNVATLSGRNTFSSRPDQAEAEFWFRVVDNGEGAGDPADEITLVTSFFGAGVPCTVDFQLSPNTDLLPIEGGNIQVHE